MNDISQPSTRSPEKKLSTISAIQISAFLGGLPGAFYLLSKNFETLGDKTKAKKSLLYGVTITLILYILLVVLPTKITTTLPNSMIPIISTAIIGIYANKLQAKSIKEGLSSGIKRHSAWKTLYVTILSLVFSVMTFVFLLLVIPPYKLAPPLEYSLGMMILPQNQSIGIKLLQKAAEHDPIAQFNLGTFYLAGKYVPQNYNQATYWFQKSAAQNYSEAQNNLGAMYYKGQGVPQNFTTAIQWYLKAANQGNALAELSLGSAYHYGKGVPQDDVEAIKWDLKAAEQGNTTAETLVGSAYHLGMGVAQNDAEAETWLQKAAAQGNPQANNLLQDLNSVLNQKNDYFNPHF